MRRFLRLAVLTVVAGLLLAACGSAPQSRTSPSPTPRPGALATPSATPSPVPAVTPPPATTAPTPTAPTPTPTPATGTNPTPAPATGTVSRCLVSQLSLSAGQGNAAAGTVGRPFIFTNTSQTTCALYGYPGMLMLGGGGQPIPTVVVRTPGPEQTVTVPPGQTASFLAWWHDQTGYQTPCPTSQQVEVTPPNAYSHLTMPASIQACPDGTINVTAVTAGSAGGQPA